MAGTGRNNDEHILSLPPQPRPLLVFPHHGQHTFYDFRTQKCVEPSVPWLHNSLCRAAADGWLLLQDLDSLKISLLHPTTMQRLSFPEAETEINDEFLCRFSSPSNGLYCHLIAIHRTEGFYLYCQPGATEWIKYELNEGEGGDYDVQAAAVCNGKLYILFLPKLLVIDLVSCAPVSSLQAKLSSPYGWRFGSIYDLVESCGDLYIVERFVCGDDSSSFCRTIVVYKMSSSSSPNWKVVKNIENRVFTIGEDYSMSLSAPNAEVEGDFIYFCGWDGVFYSFDLQSRSLSIEFPCQDVDDNWSTYWLPLDQPLIKQAESSKDMIKAKRSAGGLSYSKALLHFDHPRSFSFIYSHLITWSPPTPWLMFTHGYDDDIFHFLDPCSNKVYELHIPELSDKEICFSRDGWLIALEETVHFINPFTKKRVDLPFQLMCKLDGIACSSVPTSSDCLVFGIFNSDNGEVHIHLYRFRDNSWTYKAYTSNNPLDPSCSCPVYHNGLFCYLGLNGSLGIYDPIADTWTVFDSWLLFDVPVNKSFLVDSNGELLSVFFDLYENLIGVFVMDFDYGKWKQVKHLGDRTLFVGMEASFIVAPVEQRMANKIYLPKFRGDSNHDLVVHHVGMESVFRPCKTTEYMHVWVEPKAVVFGLDQRTGISILPVIRDQADQ